MSESINVHGISIRPGVSKNGIMYTTAALKEFIPTLANKPILKDHNTTVDNTVGLVESSFEQGVGVGAFEGWVKEDGTDLLTKIKDGRIKEVSIGAFAEKLVYENDDDEFLTAVGLSGMELSLTPTPAVEGTSVKQALESIEKRKLGEKVVVKPIFESLDLSEYVKKNKEVKMTADDKIAEEKVKFEKELREKVEKELSEKIEKETREKVEKEITEKLAKDAELKEAADKKALEEKAKVETELREKIEKELREKIEQEIKEKAQGKTQEKNTKGKVSGKTDETASDEKSDYVLETSDIGGGVSLYKNPKADGSY